MVVALVLLVVLDLVVNKTKLGRGIRAVAQDAETASLMGVHIDRTISLTFVLGGLMGGAAGFPFRHQFGVIYTMGFVPGLKAFTAAVLGGIGNIRGAVIGGLLLGLFENIPCAGCRRSGTTSSPSASWCSSCSSGPRASSVSGWGERRDRHRRWPRWSGRSRPAVRRGPWAGGEHARAAAASHRGTGSTGHQRLGPASGRMRRSRACRGRHDRPRGEQFRADLGLPSHCSSPGCSGSSGSPPCCSLSCRSGRPSARRSGPGPTACALGWPG